jgi:hypothetical protein
MHKISLYHLKRFLRQTWPCPDASLEQVMTWFQCILRLFPHGKHNRAPDSLLLFLQRELSNRQRHNHDKFLANACTEQLEQNELHRHAQESMKARQQKQYDQWIERRDQGNQKTLERKAHEEWVRCCKRNAAYDHEENEAVIKK